MHAAILKSGNVYRGYVETTPRKAFAVAIYPRTDRNRAMLDALALLRAVAR